MAPPPVYPVTWAPGWYPDPHDESQWRYWDGSQWAPRTANPGPAESETPARPVQRTGAAGPSLRPGRLVGKGVTGRVEVDESFVTIIRKGAMAKVSYGWTRGEKRIPLDAITAVQFKAPGLARGYIQFTLGGGTESRKGIIDATKDENSVLFGQRHRSEFTAIRDFIERRIAGRSSHGNGPAPTSQPDVARQLRDLAGLRDEGIITADEFDAQKARILDQT